MDLPIKVEGIMYAVKDGGFSFLLLKRTPEDGDFWQPLTEGLEDGETVEACLRRGVLEETGVKEIREITERLWSFPWENKKGEPMIDLVYGVELDANASITINPDEHSEYKWVSFAEAMGLLGRENNKKAFLHFKEKKMNSSDNPRSL